MLQPWGQDESEWHDEDEGFEMPRPDDPAGVVILLGGIAREGVTTSVKSTGRKYISKLFRSSPDNWYRMAGLIKAYGVNSETQIVCQLTDEVLANACQPYYNDAFWEVMKSLPQERHIVLIYHKTLLGDFDLPAYFFGNHGEDIETKMKLLVAQLKATNMNYIPYRTRVEFNTTVQDFLDGSNGLVLRIYVPNDRLWGVELDRLLTLFHDYLKRVSGLSVTLNQSRTEHGTSYNYHSKDPNFSKEKWGDSLQEFNDFLNVCAVNADQASTILREARVPEGTVRDIIARYSRESRRLLLDLEYAHKRAVDEIQYRFKSELQDIATLAESESVIQTLLERVIPSSGSPSQLTTLTQSPAFPASQQIFNITNAQFIGSAKGIIGDVINGDISYTENDERLLELIKVHSSGVEPTELQSALEELKDSSAPSSERLSAWQRLQTFLIRHSDKIEDLTFKMLTAYIEAALKS